MSDLSNTILNYYFSHLAELTPEKKFHLASRLYLFSQDKQAKQLLAEMKEYFTAQNNPILAVKTVVEDVRSKPSHGSKNAAALREPYFRKYPELKAYLNALFRINFLLTVYEIDLRDEFFKLFEQSEVEAMRQSLLSDPDAIAMLSTHAINFLYLYDRMIKTDQASLPCKNFYDIGLKQYDLTNPLHIQLLIYLFTHCVIGESRFYARELPPENLTIYIKMMQYLEDLIGKHYDKINLDNKFEFLVCAKIVGFDSVLVAQINNEAARSISEDGSFLIDRHNKNPQLHNTSLDSSEHRNVLFIMAQAQFTPVVRP